MIVAYKKKANIAGIVCLAALIGIAILEPFGVLEESSFGSTLLMVTFAIAFICGCYFLIKAKNRSDWWMLLVLLNVLGLLILVLLKDNATGDHKKIATSS